MRPLAVLRVVSLLEGASYLCLLLVAMPLKYLAGWPVAVQVAGAGHGWLFVAFVAALAWAFRANRWTIGSAALLFVLSLVPFGFLVIDRRLRGQTGPATDGPSPTAA